VTVAAPLCDIVVTMITVDKIAKNHLVSAGILGVGLLVGVGIYLNRSVPPGV
jgi:hypothetical protein